MDEYSGTALVIVALAFLTHGFSLVTIHKHYYGKERKKEE